MRRIVDTWRPRSPAAPSSTRALRFRSAICRNSDKTPTAMASNKSGCPRHDIRQFNLNFFVNIFSDQGSEPTSHVPMDDGGEVGNAPAVLSIVVPDVRAGLEL